MTIRAATLTAVTEVLDDAREGHPRWVVVNAANAGQAAVLSREVVSAGAARGFVPVDVLSYHRAAAQHAGRTLLLMGGFTKSTDVARAVLLDAAARSSRPHVLVTFRLASGHGCGAVREARTVYGTGARLRAVSVQVSSEVQRQIDRASRADLFRQSGRHAAAERLLRDVAASLVRRQAHEQAAPVFITLGRLLLERGRPPAADRAFEEAANASTAGGAESTALDARIWQALARTDAGRLSEAESICRAVLLAGQISSDRHDWVRAVLARVHCLQGRYPEAAPLVVGSPCPVGALDPVVAASIEATAIRVLVGIGDLFQAGVRAQALQATWAGSASVPALIATVARLRVLAAGGHLDLAEQAWRAIAGQVRELRVPLRGLRARLIWADALERAARSREAQRERRAVARLQRVAPAGLRRAIEMKRSTAPSPSAVAAPLPALGVELITTAHEQEDDRVALKRIMNRIAAEIMPIRLDLVSAAAGPTSSIMTVGIGAIPRIAQRLLEAGIRIQSDEVEGREIGVPIRCSGRLVGGLVARWPFDRVPPANTVDVLTLAAAVGAPRVDALLEENREASRAAVAVPELIGVSAAMADVRKAIERAARAPFAVLIEGESGVGKELAARAIHHLSARRERAFCDVNCAALPDELLESELFGHAKGAFTGAVADKPGLFEQADGGTLFLDEVADLSLRGQAKLLRAIQQQEVRRVGETFTRRVDVRIVAAANRDMRAEVAAGRFRGDLLFRLDVVHLRIPPLRERPEDIPVLARHCWKSAAARVQSDATLTHGVLAALASHAWPGNVRELQNVIAALAVAAPARGSVRASLLPAIITAAAPAGGGSLADARIDFERRFVRAALARAGANRTRAARELRLSRQGLLKTLARLGLEPQDRSADDAMDATGCS